MDQAMKRFLVKASSLIPTKFAPSVSKLNTKPNAHTTGSLPKDVLPPTPHPRPYEHIALLVTSQGLLIRPHLVGPSDPPNAYVRIGWGKAGKVEELEGDGEDTGINWNESVIIYGVVGILELFSVSYLLVISSKAEVGCLFDSVHTVYAVKSVIAIPLIEERAAAAIHGLVSRNAGLSQPSLLPMDAVHAQDNSDNGTPRDPSSRVVQFHDSDQVKLLTPRAPRELDIQCDQDDDVLLSGTTTPMSEDTTPTFLVAKALAAKLSFWNLLSKRTSPQHPASAENQPLDSGEQQKALDSLMNAKEHSREIINSILAATAPPPATSEEKHSELEDKIVRECIREFTKGGMYFSYDFDLTRSLQHKQEQFVNSRRKHDLLVDLDAADSPSCSPGDGKVTVLPEAHPTLPLWRRIDRRHWWNEWLSKPFIDVGLHSYILPIMQGFFQISRFEIPREPVAQEEGDSAVVDYIIISRRARDRAGLRYQRRGIDDDAHVANFVETETIMRVEREGSSNIFSYVQIRGSIPLFWTQSSYGLKPPPVLSPDRTRSQNLETMRRHFQSTISRYGPHTVVNLAEQHGKEGSITQAFREYMQEMDHKDAHYCEYDFHKETKGMKYENISHLTDTMGSVFDQQGFFWISDHNILSEQKAVFRVNCIDCLDRTNVVQSAFARHILNKQLGAVALLNPEIEGTTDTDIIFNDVWANNGDAISRAYAGTSALKGGFTRTGKRDLTGMLNDGVNSLARMYSSTFSDWFCQAVIDFMLGYRTLSVFSEFLLKLQSTDPREIIRLSKIRSEAISTSVSRVLSEGERFLSGWTLFSPEQLNTKITTHFEEKVLLLTATAVYIVSYDYNLEKVKSFTRAPIGDIVGISKGAYIISPLEEASRDPLQNAGFVISWLNSNQVTRLCSYSLRNSLAAPVSPLPSPSPAAQPVFIRQARNQLTNLSRKGFALSKLLLSNASITASSNRTFSTFKVLPIDPARRQESIVGDNPSEVEDELAGASNCKEAADLIVDAIHRACEDFGSAQDGFVTEADVVSLAEAERMTSVYAKMEYGVKRLLWLGG